MLEYILKKDGNYSGVFLPDVIPKSWPDIIEN